jgi:hypothetical protein
MNIMNNFLLQKMHITIFNVTQISDIKFLKEFKLNKLEQNSVILLYSI